MTTPPTDSPRILLVDDEPNVLRSLERCLRREGYAITTTSSPQEALALISEQAFAVIVSDQRMPGIEGTQLLAKARELSPATSRLLLTGYADVTAAVEAINTAKVMKFLSKPWDEAELRETLRMAVREHRCNLAKGTQSAQEAWRLVDELRDQVETESKKASRLGQDLQRTLRGSLEGLTQLAELHSPEIIRHGRRVAEVSQRIAVRMGLGADQLLYLQIGALLHDVGLVAVSPQDLRSGLNAISLRKREAHQQHPVAGEELVRKLPGMEEAARIVRNHHERWDGEGYPDRLLSDSIPLGARIVAAADAYDLALSGGYTARALGVVKKLSGTGLDPDVVNALAVALEQDEVPLPLVDLEPGMVVSRPISSSEGVVLVPADTLVGPDLISRLRRYRALRRVSTERAELPVYVYRLDRREAKKPA